MRAGVDSPKSRPVAAPSAPARSAPVARSVLLITHRPEGLDLVGDVVVFGDVASVLDES
jgi:hypothetical protein